MNQETPKQIRLKQLRFRAWRRGFREHDFLMGTYADENIENMSDEELNDFDDLLNQQDWDVYYWIIGGQEVPPEFQTKTLENLQSFAALKKTMWKGEINS